jgi:hypothetical protein
MSSLFITLLRQCVSCCKAAEETHPADPEGGGEIHHFTLVTNCCVGTNYATTTTDGDHEGEKDDDDDDDDGENTSEDLL